MERDKIGARLKEAIKKRKFKQEEFAEKCGISYPALKRYMSGKNVYTYEHLEKFAEVLDCSYDYLLGKSDSFKQEYHEVTKMTHLSEEAIGNIYKRAKYYDEEFEARRYIMVLDLLLREEETFESICSVSCNCRGRCLLLCNNSSGEYSFGRILVFLNRSTGRCGCSCCTV